jgi:hypothetical protein
LDEVTTATLEVLDDIAETTLDEVFDEVDEIFDEDLDDALLATFEELDEVFVEVFDEVFVEALLVVELDDNFVDDFVDELFDEDLVASFVVEVETFLDDVLLVGVEMALPSTHVHSLTKSLAEYLMNGDVVLGLGPCQ